MYAYRKIFLCIGMLSYPLRNKLTTGGVSAAFIPIVAWMMPNSPTTARFLRKGDDRLIALDRIRDNNTGEFDLWLELTAGTKSSKWKWGQVRETFCDPKVSSVLSLEANRRPTFGRSCSS